MGAKHLVLVLRGAGSASAGPTNAHPRRGSSDVEYRQRTDAGILRQPSSTGIRPDLSPADLPVQPGPEAGGA